MFRMDQRYRDFCKVADISNDLDRLLPVGTLNFHSLPTENCALQAIPVDDHGWRWLDIEFLHDFHIGKFHPVSDALDFFLRHRYAIATCKVFQVSISPSLAPIPICKVRLYVVPQDIEGSRFFREWRLQWPAKRLIPRYERELQTLMKALDYSREGWNGPEQLHCSISAYVAKSALLIPVTGTKPNSDFLLDSSLFHFARWQAQQPFFILEHTEQKSLDSIVKNIYSNISGPDLSDYRDMTVRKRLGLPNPEEVIASLINRYPVDQSLLPGVKATLYPFQMKSLCKMLEKESFVLKVPVPYFQKLISPTGKVYYFDILENGFYNNPEYFTPPRGGILAENMGLGKTLICLSLICLTKFDISTVPDDLIVMEDNGPRLDVPDKLAFANFRLKSLSDLCRRVIAQNLLPWKLYEDDIPQSVVRKLTGCHGCIRVEISSSLLKRERRTGDRLPTITSRDLYLSNTTLLIVPENLLHQWNQELQKHIEPSYLQKLFISERFKTPINSEYASYVNQVPDDPGALTQFDLVVITVPLFAKFGRSESNNALGNIYWKRLIIDEGHSMSSKSSNLSTLCRSLYAERRWVVTGTPTSGLTNLHMDEEENTQDTIQESPSKKKRKYVVKSKFNVRDDLVKLGNLIGTFFQIEPFHSRQTMWNNTIVRNLAGSVYSTEQCLQSFLNSLMVRHNLLDVENDLKLPQLHHEAVFLSPSYLDKLSINLFTAVLAVNAVSSEREGGDYMFDPSNRQQLRRLVNNLQLATFYWTGFQSEDVNTLIGIAKHCLEKKNADGELLFGIKDQTLLHLSISAAQEAIGNPRWRTASMLHEMEYFVDGLTSPFVKSFGIGVVENSSVGVYGAPQLAAIQEFFYKNRFLDMSDKENLGVKLEAASRPFWNTYWNDTARKENSKFKKQETSHDFDVNGLKQSINKDIEQSKVTISPPRKTSGGSQDWTSTRASFSENGWGATVEERGMEEKSVVSNLEVKESAILGTASAKLSYLASRLVDHQKENVKSIVFFEFEDSAYYLTELLDILGVNYILYATFISASQRSNNLADFDRHNSAVNGGVTLIMDLKLASHGLTIISATRVYFLNPVWQRSVEAQAIKRAHRIGQTNEVYVETLVLRGTLEEEIYRRREQDEPHQEQSDSSRRYVIDDTGMQQFILKHQFLSTSESHAEYARFSALDLNQEHQLEKRPLDDDFDSLLSHESRRELQMLHWYKTWTMRLFNPDNILKLTATKKQKATIDQLNSELVEGKAEWSPVSQNGTKSRKRVRF